MPLLELKLTNESPVLLGGYDTQWERQINRISISEGLRTQSLKGLWRWWMRAYLAGVMWDEGYTEIEKPVIKITDKLLGSAAEKGEASKIKLKTLDESSTGDVIDGKSQMARKYARIKFMTMKGREKISYAKTLTSRVILDVRMGIDLKDNEKKFATGSFLTALMLSGLGKASRRGFGTFHFQVENDQTRAFTEIFRGYQIENVEETLRRLIKTTYDSAKKLIEKHEYTEQGGKIPPIPSLTLFKRIDRNPIFELIIAKGKSVDEAIKDINDFCTRPMRLRKMGMGFRAQDNITKQRVAWVLGLPRAQRGTGYFSSVKRRASPFIFSAHSEWLSASIFLSKDWGESPKLTWKSGRGGRSEREIYIQAGLLKAYSTVKTELQNYLKRLGYEVVGVVPWE